MENIFNYSFVVTFIWFGFVAAISFMEAPVKFKTPSLSLPVGLDVGRHVFGVLNKIELIFAVVILTSLFIIKNISIISPILFILILLILLWQTFYALPELNKRASIYIDGGKPSVSKVHKFYVVFELIKIISLFWIGILQINSLT